MLALINVRNPKKVVLSGDTGPAVFVPEKARSNYMIIDW